MPSHKERREMRRAAVEAARDRTGRIKPEILVEQAKNKKHPFHRAFVWDDSKAAHLYRVEVAKDIIKSFKFEVIINDVRIVAPYYVSDPSSRGSAYLETRKIADKEAAARLTLLDELSRVQSAIIRGRSLAAVFGLTGHFEKLLRDVVQVKARIEALQVEVKQKRRIARR